MATTRHDNDNAQPTATEKDDANAMSTMAKLVSALLALLLCTVPKHAANKQVLLSTMPSLRSVVFEITTFQNHGKMVCMKGNYRHHPEKENEYTRISQRARKSYRNQSNIIETLEHNQFLNNQFQTHGNDYLNSTNDLHYCKCSKHAPFQLGQTIITIITSYAS